MGISLKISWDYLLSPMSFEGTETVFIIARGESTDSIAKKLQQANLIRSPLIFRIYLKMTNQAGSLQAGDFKLSPKMSVPIIVYQLSHGVVDKWVTLLEGWRVEEMAEELNNEININNGEFIKKAREGQMFPDTYLFRPDSEIDLIVQTLENNFQTKYDQKLQDKIKNLGLTPQEGIILASIIEREARSSDDRQMVASILLKRFKIGMGLNADATVQYALVPKGTIKPPSSGWWKKKLSKEDLKINSPYNTYLYQGLPPAPICNPSLSALQAVTSATTTPYLYYYHDSKGVAHYGKTLEEHNKNIINYP